MDTWLMTRRQRSAMPLHERAEPALRLIAAGMAVVFASTAVVMVLVAMDESTWAAAAVGSRSEGLWAAAACIAGAAFGVVYAWKGGRWIRGLLRRAAWPSSPRRD